MNIQKSIENKFSRNTLRGCLRFLLILVFHVADAAKYLTYLLKPADVTQIIVESMANFGQVFYYKKFTETH